MGARNNGHESRIVAYASVKAPTPEPPSLGGPVPTQSRPRSRRPSTNVATHHSAHPSSRHALQRERTSNAVLYVSSPLYSCLFHRCCLAMALFARVRNVLFSCSLVVFLASLPDAVFHTAGGRAGSPAPLSGLVLLEYCAPLHCHLS
jgi:hypothetical protein